jgi:pimeloyl-ACP methyl ester carboxylesterase
VRRAPGRRLRAPIAVLALAGLLGVAGTASAGAQSAAASSPRPAGTLRVGSLTLHRCHVYAGAYCGHLARPWDPTGDVPGDLSVGFAFVPATDGLGNAVQTVVPHEGGPGYSTTGSALDYAAMYGPLLRDHNLLLIDQRGTGLSAPIDCPELQNLHGPYDIAAGKCGRSLGDHADLYGSTLSADDEAAVIRALGLGPVELYGDSYGTFYTQVFAGRHPKLVDSIVLDSAYPTSGETAWYPTQTPAMRQSLTTACNRSPACASAPGTPIGLLRRVLHQVRQSPYRGIGYDADGVRHHVVVRAESLVGVAFGATYGPEYYREFAAALRSALAGDREPLLRLVAETNYGSADDGAVTAYSEGLDAAVTCQDYPQLFSMADPPATRKRQYKASVRVEERRDPGVYAPFSVENYLHSVWQEDNWCLDWPSPSPAHPAGPPSPPSGHYPAAPTLILSGELDSITTPAEGALVAAQFPDSRQILVANSFHVTAEDDTDGCAVSILRQFVAQPEHPLPGSVTRCARVVPPVRAIGAYSPSFTGMPPATAVGTNHVGVRGRRAAASAAETVADLMDRWPNNYSGHGVGLYGGTWAYTGTGAIRFGLHDVRLDRDLAVSGRFVWHRYRHRLSCRLNVERVSRSGAPVVGSAVNGTVSGRWNTRRRHAIARLAGQLGGRDLDATMTAP